MKKFFSFLFSMLFTGILLVIFIIAIAYATFIENDYGALTAKILIYNSRWMEVLYILLTVNLVGSMFKYKLVNRKKWSVLVFHLAFIVIVLGASITRYFGYEGTLMLAEGETKNKIKSEAAFIRLEARGETDVYKDNSEVMFSPNTPNRYSQSMEIDGVPVKIRLQGFYTGVYESIMEDNNGGPALGIAVTDYSGNSNEFTLSQGLKKKIGEYSYSLGKVGSAGSVQFAVVDDSIIATAADTIHLSGTMGETEEKYSPGVAHRIYPNKIYNIGSQRFMIHNALTNGKTTISREKPFQGSTALDALHFELSVGELQTELFVIGRKGYIGSPVIYESHGVEIQIAYGSIDLPLPFSIQLRDFQLERYPGSNSPSSFASEVTLIDPSQNLEMPYRIFMNNILKHKGYRFFQSSYTTDEKGTILSVNRDAAGTTITYFGYFLMMLGMVLTLLNRNSHFKIVLKKLARLKSGKTLKNVTILVIFITFSQLAGAQGMSGFNPLNVEEEHLQEFSELLVQDHQGRIKPVSSLSSEILRKLTRKNSFEGMSPEEVMLDMSANSSNWFGVKILKVAHSDIRDKIMISGKLASFNDLVKSNTQGGYLLQNMVNEAFQKKPVNRNKLDKELMNVDERINILNQVLMGTFLKVFPVPGDENHKWITAREAAALVQGEDARFIQEALPNYFSAVMKAQQTGDYRAASAYLKQIKAFQKKYSHKVIPSDSKIKLEVFYNKWNIFNKLAKYYIFAGLLFLIIHFIRIFNPARQYKWPARILSYVIILLFIAHTAGLGIRWYIAGHAPWSNGYESMIYVGWATLLSGLIFKRRSPITLAATTVLAALVLFVAGMSWMNPEITNLVPVLKSYWLIVHVAVITASYGFLALGALMGFLNLNLMIFRNSKNEQRLNNTITEMSYIIEVTLIIGLVMMTSGSFLGAIWANESWGRYWGWDPKETWSLVTILVYTFALHMRRIEGFKGHFALSTAALVSISSVLMTYFGVNYYLSGLHSYGQGDPPPIPNGVFIAVAVVLLVIFIANRSNKKYAVPVEREE